MDERVMIEWFENILKPFIKMSSENVVIVGFRPMLHDDISGGSNPTAWCRS